VIFSWQGEVIEEDAERLVLRAPWVGDKPLFLGYTIFEAADIFVETYFRDRWYSIWEVQSHRTGRTKGWYCNVCQPLEIDGDQVRFVDMELDVFVFPDGRYVVLDEDELEMAMLTPEVKAAARTGLDEVLQLVEGRVAPFDHIGPPRRVEPFWDDGPRNRD